MSKAVVPTLRDIQESLEFEVQSIEIDKMDFDIADQVLLHEIQTHLRKTTERVKEMIAQQGETA